MMLYLVSKGKLLICELGKVGNVLMASMEAL